MNDIVTGGIDYHSLIDSLKEANDQRKLFFLHNPEEVSPLNPNPEYWPVIVQDLRKRQQQMVNQSQTVYTQDEHGNFVPVGTTVDTTPQPVVHYRCNGCNAHLYSVGKRETCTCGSTALTEVESE